MNAEEWRKRRAQGQSEADQYEIEQQRAEIDIFLASNKTEFEPTSYQLHPVVLAELAQRGYKVKAERRHNIDEYGHWWVYIFE